MAGDRAPQPSKEAWEVWKQSIRKWYLTENWTCGEIQRALEAQRFRVSERQIKNRLNEWKFERKKTLYPLYLAMLVVSEHYKERGVEVEFDVPKRETRVIYTTQKVKKECERVRKRLMSNSESINLPALHEAECLLAEAEISWKERQLVVHRDLTQPHGNLVPWDGHARNIACCVFSPKAEADIVVLHENSPFNDFHCQRDGYFVTSDSYSGSGFRGYQNGSAHPSPSLSEGESAIYTPRSIQTPQSLSLGKPEVSPLSYCIPPFTPRSDQISSTSSRTHVTPRFNAGQPLDQATLASDPPTSPSTFCSVKLEQDVGPSHICFSSENHLRSSALVMNQPSTTKSMCHRCDTPHKDYEFSNMINSLKHEPATLKSEYLEGSSFLNGIPLDRDASADDHKLTASRWAAPYYMQCISNVPQDVLQHAKAQSMQALRYALEHNNEFILPCLSWSILILGQPERMKQLAELLHASCVVINQHELVRDSFTYAIPFRYAWAWASNNEVEMKLAGRCLERSHTQIRHIWTKNHPNYFVSGYLYAWHLLLQQEYAKAIDLLTENLPVCESTMGPHDLLTISCLAVVSRAYGEIGNLREAVRYLRKAMIATQTLEADSDDTQVYRPALQRFRLSLLARHADLIFHLGEYLNAEEQFWGVLRVHGQLYGLSNVDTWNAATGLRCVLQKTGREALGEEAWGYMLKGWEWEHYRNWYSKRGEKLPAPPPAPPCWWPFQVQRSANAGSPAEDSDMEGYQDEALTRASPDRISDAFAAMTTR